MQRKKRKKLKLKEITNLKELREYLKFPVPKNKSNYDMIKEAYIKAKKKGYIFRPRKPISFFNYNYYREDDFFDY